MTPGGRAPARARRSARSGPAGTLLELTVFVSCYNEEEYIIATIEAVRDALREAGVHPLRNHRG